MNKINKWSVTPAKWWQFWRPRSGITGGLLLGLLLGLAASPWLF